MRESIYFMYDGKSSKDMGVRLTNISGLFEEIFLPSRNIIEKKVAHREKPYLQGVSHESLSFPLEIFIEEWKDRNRLREVARWLFQDHYKPLVFDSNPNRIFYAMVEGNSSLFHNGMKEGYIELNIRCDSPYSYSPEYRQDNIQFRDNQDTVISNDISSFDKGTHKNTIVTANGLTVDSVVSSWGKMYQTHQKWGELK